MCSWFTEDHEAQRASLQPVNIAKLFSIITKKVNMKKMHLMKCSKFKRALTATCFDHCFEWYTTGKCPSKATASPGLHRTTSFRSESQLSISHFVVPGLKMAEHKELSKELAMFFTTQVSFQRIEEPHLLKAFKICRPNAHIPSQKDLPGLLLNQCYEENFAKVKNALDHSNHLFVRDGWSNCSLHGRVSDKVLLP